MKQKRQRTKIYNLIRSRQKHMTNNEIAESFNNEQITTLRGAAWKGTHVSQFVWNHERSKNNEPTRKKVFAKRAPRQVIAAKDSDVIDIAELLLASNLPKNHKETVLKALLK